MGYEQHLSKTITEVLDLTTDKHQGNKIKQAIFKVITEALQRGEKVRIRGFGVFKPITLKPMRFGAYDFKNKFTYVMEVPSRKTVTFQVSEELKRTLNEDIPDDDR